MRTPRAVVLAMVLVGSVWAVPARAIVHAGDVAPAFTKNELIRSPAPATGPPVSLSDFAGRVLVIHLLGYN